MRSLILILCLFASPISVRAEPSPAFRRGEADGTFRPAHYGAYAPYPNYSYPYASPFYGSPYWGGPYHAPYWYDPYAGPYRHLQPHCPGPRPYYGPPIPHHYRR